MTFNYLTKPIRVGPLTLKNRILMTAMHTLYSQDGLPTPRFNEFYWRRAEGGAGLVVVGACRFDGKGARASTMSLAEDSCIKPWQVFTKGMREQDCPVAVQLYHAGRYMYNGDVLDPGGAVAPSAVYTPFTKETARAMTLEELHAIIDAWAEGARRAREAGFDAVEISGSAGYLISQFLSPLTNLREDEYGGSFENRCRFPLEVIAAVRKAVGPDYPVLLRYGAHTLVPGAGGSDECRAFAPLAEKAGIDLLDLTGGWHESRTPQLTGEMPRGGLSYLAAGIREDVDIPVAMANRMSDPVQGEKALALGRCDMVAIGRALIAEPDLPRFIMEGRPEKIRHCTSCNQGCLAGTFFDKPIRCLANGMAGREWELKLTPAAEPKNILVVGGGPAGMECALRAAQRGHHVTIWEKNDRLGGLMAVFSTMPGRREFADLLAWYRRALAESGVNIEVNRQADPESILSGGFDMCVLANGRGYKEKPVPVEPDGVPVYTVLELLLERPVLPARVGVIGGSFVGLEAARYLLMDGSMSPEDLFYRMRYGVEPDERLHEMLKTSDRRIAVFEKDKLGRGYEPGVAWPTLGDLKSMGAELKPHTVVEAVTAAGIRTEEGTWPCDAVVMCVGTKPDDALKNALEGHIPVATVGNAHRLGRAIDAIETACELGLTI
ncbi:MAG: FAD-dependent oxidoreductase [Oscillospiraceae bacterium]|nr:FAD-dependent oxidoreductase [Oscillospiraceae bacterium]